MSQVYKSKRSPPFLNSAHPSWQRKKYSQVFTDVARNIFWGARGYKPQLNTDAPCPRADHTVAGLLGSSRRTKVIIINTTPLLSQQTKWCVCWTMMHRLKHISSSSSSTLSSILSSIRSIRNSLRVPSRLIWLVFSVELCHILKMRAITLFILFVIVVGRGLEILAHVRSGESSSSLKLQSHSNTNCNRTPHHHS